MKKLKHNKLRNTGLLYEILSKNVMHEVLNGETRPKSISIIKRHFNKDSQLLRELSYYQTLCRETKNDGNELLKLTLESRQKLDLKKLESEKYNLIHHLKKHYDLKTFFETRTSNYKLTASVFKLFEYYDNNINPDEYLTSKSLVLEHLSGKKYNNVEEEVEIEWRQQDKDTQKLAFRILIEKFNEQYSGLNRKQKTLLARYINEDISAPEFKNYVISEVSYIVSKLGTLNNRISDQITKIKLNETIDLAQNILNSQQIKDEHLSAMLKYYELIQELDK